MITIEKNKVLPHLDVPIALRLSAKGASSWRLFLLRYG